MMEDMAKKTGNRAQRESGKEELIVGVREPKLLVRKVSWSEVRLVTEVC